MPVCWEEHLQSRDLGVAQDFTPPVYGRKLAPPSTEPLDGPELNDWPRALSLVKLELTQEPNRTGLMRRIVLTLCAALGPPPTHAEPTSRPLRFGSAGRRCGRGCSARGEDVEDTLKTIHNSGGLNRLTTLKTRLDALHRMTVSARMAVDVAVEEMGTVPAE